jgi:hypothetical protein
MNYRPKNHQQTSYTCRGGFLARGLKPEEATLTSAIFTSHLQRRVPRKGIETWRVTAVIHRVNVSLQRRVPRKGIETPPWWPASRSRARPLAEEDSSQRDRNAWNWTRLNSTAAHRTTTETFHPPLHAQRPPARIPPRGTPYTPIRPNSVALKVSQAPWGLPNLLAPPTAFTRTRSGHADALGPSCRSLAATRSGSDTSVIARRAVRSRRSDVPVSRRQPLGMNRRHRRHGDRAAVP